MHQINKKTNLQFPDEFFKEEVRCEYVVTEKLKKIWAVEIDLLNELLSVCKKHDIKVIVYAGTLLGAIRHKGMIPWDDDIDVALTRPEYEKLCKIAPNEFKHPYFFQNAKTDKRFFCGYSRLRNSLTTGLIKEMETTEYNNGIYIDVFVLDGYIEDDYKLGKQMHDIKVSERIVNAYTYQYYTKNPLKIAIKAVVFSLLRLTYCKKVPYDKHVERYNSILSRYTAETDRLTLMTHNMNFIPKYWLRKRDFDDIIYVDFENIKVPVPRNYDSVLRHTYGNYKDFPPVEKRGKWHEGIIKFDPDIPYVDFIKQKRYKNEEHI